MTAAVCKSACVCKWLQTFLRQMVIFNLVSTKLKLSSSLRAGQDWRKNK